MVTENWIRQASHIFFWGLLFIIGFFHLASPLLTILFAFLVLSKLQFISNKPLALLIYIIAVISVLSLLAWFCFEAVIVLPKVFNKILPIILDYANDWGFELPFNDSNSLKSHVVGEISTRAASLAHFLKVAGREIVFIFIGIVAAAALFFNPKLDRFEGHYLYADNAYSALCRQIAKRYRAFYESFSIVMGAQILISTINTFFTAIFVISIGLPYPTTIITVAFISGLFPIIGNVVSNTVITGVALTVSFNKAILALVFLIVLHKLEYFLNSKLIGGRIQNPMWLLLFALIIGEILMGIPGMILAPVILHYIRTELGQVRVKDYQKALQITNG